MKISNIVALKRRNKFVLCVPWMYNVVQGPMVKMQKK